MSDQEELQRMVFEINLLERQVQELQGQIQTIRALKNENNATRKALNGLPQEETFFGLGSGTLVKAKVTDAQKALIEIGAGVVAEKSIGDAVAILGERDTRMEALLARLENDLKNTGEALDSVSIKAGALQEKIRGS